MQLAASLSKTVRRRLKCDWGDVRGWQQMIKVQFHANQLPWPLSRKPLLIAILILNASARPRKTFFFLSSFFRHSASTIDRKSIFNPLTLVWEPRSRIFPTRIFSFYVNYIVRTGRDRSREIRSISEGINLVLRRRKCICKRPRLKAFALHKTRTNIFSQHTKVVVRDKITIIFEDIWALMI